MRKISYLRKRGKQKLNNSKQKRKKAKFKERNNSPIQDMNINYYDTDCSTWFPTGKLYQVEYATKAVDQGSICIGLRSETHAVLVCQKRSSSQLSGYQDKVFQISDKIGMGIAGITADASNLAHFLTIIFPIKGDHPKSYEFHNSFISSHPQWIFLIKFQGVLCKYMRTECLNHKYVYGSQHPVQRLVLKVAEKSQHKTQVSGKRPYGVGTLIIAQDVNLFIYKFIANNRILINKQQDGPHLFQTLPSGEFYEFHAYSIGARSQTARTYLEANMDHFKHKDLKNLILHGLAALHKANQGDDEYA